MKKEIVKQLAVLITGAFGLVAALAWNGAIQEIFKKFVGESDTLTGMIIFKLGLIPRSLLRRQFEN